MAELERVTNSQGQPIGWATPGQPLLAEILRRHAAQTAAQEARAQAIRAGLLPPGPPEGSWLISDRH
jgi:hypothetical protein